MGFVRLNCSVCKGKGFTNPEAIGSTCLNCNGEGSILTHANFIGSNITISVDPASPSGDEAWAVAWKRNDEGVIIVVESSKIEDHRPKVDTPKIFPPRTYRCTSGRGLSCTCYACHGG